MSASPHTVQLFLPKPHPAQQDVIDHAARFNVLAWGRRAGKSVLEIDRVCEVALRGQPAGWFAPSYKLLAEAWRGLVSVLRPVASRTNESEHRIELVTGGVIEAWSLDSPDPARGRKYARVVIDEAALVQRFEEAWNAAIRPTLADLQGDAWFGSTPRGRNCFWQLFQRGRDASHPDWRSWQMPTSTNPYIPAEEIERARESTPERFFLQEFEARFLDDAGGVFRGVREAATATPQEEATGGHQYIAGLDWGKTADFTVISIVDVTTMEQVALDRFNRIDYTLQLERLKGMVERFNPSTIIAERNSMGEPLVREGLPVQPFLTTNATKATAIEALALAFERHTLRILNDPVQIEEFEAFESTRLPSGLTRYAAPEGMHDDTVMALALVMDGLRNAISPGWIAFANSRMGDGIGRPA
jgi:hypothetical protein